MCMDKFEFLCKKIQSRISALPKRANELERLADRCFLSHSHRTLHRFCVTVAVRDHRCWLFAENYKTMRKLLN